MLPVKTRTILRAKLLCSLLIDLLAILFTLVVLEVALQLSWAVVLGAVALTLVMRYAAVALMLTVDAVHPVLNWTTETQAIKQNVNVFFGMLVCLVLLALPVLGVVLLAQHGAVVRLAAAVGVTVLEAVLGAVAVHTVAERRYEAIE